ncbi:MAG: hypothetical protein JWM88_1920 [Verrucomicrobia bacterium]|nr:hypothetical protein [Verrucomicrobiota bacterium]
MDERPYLIHLESPLDTPSTTEYLVRGWVVSKAPIRAVTTGRSSPRFLELAERPDVRTAYPDYPHVAGFAGRASADSLRGDCLSLTCVIGETDYESRHELNPKVLPPAALQIRQVGSEWGRNFYLSGGIMFDQITAAFEEHGLPLANAARVLDFGCGCGRVLKHFDRFPHQGEIWGCDIDPESIAWNRTHLAGVARFDCNASLPPMAFPDGFFDAIYSVSVFTHLPEDMQFRWLEELRRILRPGGLLLASLHGARYWEVDPGVKQEVLERGFAYRRGEATKGLPDFYMCSFHSEAYVRRAWGKYFDFEELKPSHLYGAHDSAILRRPS